MVEASALVLLLGAWKNICSKQCAEKNQDLKLVHSVLDMLSEIEGRRVIIFLNVCLIIIVAWGIGWALLVLCGQSSL